MESIVIIRDDYEVYYNSEKDKEGMDWIKAAIILRAAEKIDDYLANYGDDIRKALANLYPGENCENIIDVFKKNVVNYFVENSNPNIVENGKYADLDEFNFVEKMFEDLLSKAKPQFVEIKNFTDAVLVAIGDAKEREREMEKLLESLSDNQKKTLIDIIDNNKIDYFKKFFLDID